MIRRKIDIIEECEDCSHIWWYLGTTECCLLMNKKRCELTDDNLIPDWCPLPDAKLEEK